MLASIRIPDDIIPEEITTSSLPKNWREYPAPPELADIGTDWALRNESLLLRVPSAVVKREFNILINPRHPDMKHISISTEKYELNHRTLDFGDVLY